MQGTDRHRRDGGRLGRSATRVPHARFAREVGVVCVRVCVLFDQGAPTRTSPEGKGVERGEEEVGRAVAVTSAGPAPRAGAQGQGLECGGSVLDRHIVVDFSASLDFGSGVGTGGTGGIGYLPVTGGKWGPQRRPGCEGKIRVPAVWTGLQECGRTCRSQPFVPSGGRSDSDSDGARRGSDSISHLTRRPGGTHGGRTSSGH
mmetsp:Transcript_57181/g.157750  ORF Transcript_57181/g.157750 Transcript_57181/m.157750 type:complete len:202 (-) Transcript_57181:57-662(-)